MGPAVGSLMSQYKHLSFSGTSSQFELTHKPGIFPDTASVFAETAVCGCGEWRVEVYTKRKQSQSQREELSCSGPVGSRDAKAGRLA